jgi:hypothetical protein
MNPALARGENPPPLASPMVEPVQAYGRSPSPLYEELTSAQWIVSAVWARYFAFLADQIGIPGPPGPPGPGGGASPWVTITYGATITPDLSLGTNQQCTLTGNVTVAIPTGATDGQPFVLWLIQDATGGRGITFASGYKTGGVSGYQEALTAVCIYAVMVGTTDARVISLNQGILP